MDSGGEYSREVSRGLGDNVVFVIPTARRTSGTGTEANRWMKAEIAATLLKILDGLRSIVNSEGGTVGDRLDRMSLKVQRYRVNSDWLALEFKLVEGYRRLASDDK